MMAYVASGFALIAVVAVITAAVFAVSRVDWRTRAQLQSASIDNMRARLDAKDATIKKLEADHARYVALLGKHLPDAAFADVFDSLLSNEDSDGLRASDAVLSAAEPEASGPIDGPLR